METTSILITLALTCKVSIYDMRVISIVSGKGGVGKTTTSINLSAYLSKLGKETLVIDANLNTPDISLSLGAPIIPIALQHVLSGKNKAEEAVYLHHSGTKILPSALAINADLKGLCKITEKLRNNFDFILIDSAAGLGDDVLSSIKASDECLVVINPEMPSITWAIKLIKTIERMNKKVAGIVITRKNKNQISLKNIKAMVEYPIIGIIPEDNKVKEAQISKETLLEFRSKASKGYKKLAINLINGKEEKTGGFNVKDFLKNFKINISFDKRD